VGEDEDDIVVVVAVIGYIFKILKFLLFPEDSVELNNINRILLSLNDGLVVDFSPVMNPIKCCNFPPCLFCPPGS
jgi:hypothetical protein